VARRKELKGIAAGLYGSFIGRNNDVGGYWGIGKLCLFAQQCNTHIVHLDLMSQSISPPSPDFAKLVAGYSSMLQRHLASKRIPSERVTAAVIELDFSPPYPSGKRIPIMTWGDLFRLTVSITDDRGKVHTIEDYGHCAPHDPRRERESYGPERF